MKSDWVTKPLYALADIQTGPFGSQLHQEDYVEVGTPIVTVEHLGAKQFSTQNLPLVSDKDKQRLSKETLIYSYVYPISKVLCYTVSIREERMRFNEEPDHIQRC